MSIFKKIENAALKMAAFLAPDWAKKRMTYNMVSTIISGFDAAKISGPNQLWNPAPTDADTEIRNGWRRTTDRSRDLERNNAYVSGALDKWENLTVGLGLMPQSKVVKPGTEDLDEPICRIIEDSFYKFATHACANGDSWRDGLGIVARHIKTDGAPLIIFRSLPDQPFALQIIEADQINVSVNTVDGRAQNGNYVFDGIEMTPYGKPVAYHIFDVHPGGLQMATKTTRILAEDVIYPFKRRRASQHKGVCEYASVVMPLYDHQQYREAAVHLLRIAAAYGIFIETPYPEDMLIDKISERMYTSDGQDIYKKLDYIDPTGVHYTRLGEKPQALTPSQPTQSYAEFGRDALKISASGFGLSYETFTGDFSQSNFASSKMAKQPEEAGCRNVSYRLIDMVCLPAWARWMDSFVATGRLKLPNYWAQRERYQAVRFSLPAFKPVDEVKSATADDMRLAQGTITLSEICERDGKDFTETVKALAREIEFKKSIGLAHVTDPAATASTLLALTKEDEAQAQKEVKKS